MGRLNPALYRGPATSSSSSFASPPLGSVHLSYTWIGEHYDQLKIRILKVKNILEEYSRAGLYFRWEQRGNFNLMSTFNDQLSSLFVHFLKITFLIYIRLQCVSPTAQSPTFQSSTQYGEDKRYFNDDFVFKVVVEF